MLRFASRSVLPRAALATTPALRACTSVRPSMSLVAPVRTFATKYYFARTHEYLAVEDGDTKNARVGITDHAQAQLGDIVFVDIVEPGLELDIQEDFTVLESVKAASDIYAPVTGEVTEVNTRLEEEPALINQDAQGEGWIVKMSIANEAELDQLMDEAAYKQHCEDEAH